MSDKLKLSADATVKLDNLSARLNLRKNIVCRIAIGCSLNMDESIELCDADSNGQEFNKSTIIGSDEFSIVAMIANQCNHAVDMGDYFNVTIRTHIIRGLNYMDDLYSRTNSPIEFMKILCGFRGEEFIDNTDLFSSQTL